MALISSPLASAALVGDTLPATPMMDDSGAPPSRCDRAMHMRPLATDAEASAQPRESSSVRLASCTTAGGRSS
jgi:hypothetical protein